MQERVNISEKSSNEVEILESCTTPYSLGPMDSFSLLTCVESFFPDDYDKQNLVCNHELLKYKAMEGIFGRKLAISGRSNNNDTFNPGKCLVFRI